MNNNLNTIEPELMELEKVAQYVKTGHTCPICGGASIEEETYGYEKVSYCTSCEFSASKTIA